MNYALIKEGIVDNVIWLYEGNAADFPNAVPINGRLVSIGDMWDGNDFYHDGERVLTEAEYVQREANEMREALALLGVTMNE